MHVESGPQRALGIVLVGDGGAEYGHDGVADIFLNEALVPFDGGREGREEVILEGANILGIQPLADCGEAGKVGEEDGGGPAIPAGIALGSGARAGRLVGDGAGGRGSEGARGEPGRGFGRAEPGAAARAEGEVGRRRRAAGAAQRSNLAPTLRTERKFGGHVEATAGAALAHHFDSSLAAVACQPRWCPRVHWSDRAPSCEGEPALTSSDRLRADAKARSQPAVSEELRRER